MASELYLLLEDAENLFYSEDTNEVDLKNTGQELLDRTKLLKETLETCIASLKQGAHRIATPRKSKKLSQEQVGYFS